MKTVLLGFMGRYPYSELEVTEPNLHKHRFSSAIIYEKYKKENKPIDKVICLATIDAMTNAHMLHTNIKLLADNSRDIESKMNEYNRNDAGNYEIKEDLFEIMKAENIANEKELNKTFQTIESRIKDLLSEYNDSIQLVIDVTFGYRTQPIAAIMIANLLKQKYKKISIENVWYAVIDNKTTLLSIKKHNELADWSLGLTNYMKTGETEILKYLTTQGKSNQEAKILVEKLDEFSKCQKVCRMDDIKKISEEVKLAIIAFQKHENKNDFNLIGSMFEQVKDKFKPFENEIWGPSIEWNYGNGNIQQALTIASEYFPLIIFQNSLLIETGYDQHKETPYQINEEDRKKYNAIKTFISIEDMKSYQLILKDEPRVAYLIKKEEVSLFALFEIIKKDIEGIVEKNNEKKCQFNDDNIDDLHHILFPKFNKDGKYKTHLMDLWNSIKKYHHAKLYFKINSKTEFILDYDNFEYIYSLFALDELVYKNSDISKELKKIFPDMNKDRLNPKENFTLFKKIHNYQNKNKKKINEADITLLEDYIATNEAEFKKFNKYAVNIVLQVNNTKERFNERTQLIERNQFFQNKENFDQREHFVKAEGLSSYLIDTEHQIEFKQVLDAYSLLRVYRNDINHAGTTLSKELSNLTQKIHGVNNFYEDKNEVKENLDIVSNYIRKIEKMNYVRKISNEKENI
ncbi:MAG: hypothetical protein RSC10_00515 [Longicatena sp.]